MNNLWCTNYSSVRTNTRFTVVVVSKKSKKKKKNFFFLLFLIGKNRHGIVKKVAIFDWEWGQNSAPREGQKSPVNSLQAG